MSPSRTAPLRSSGSIRRSAPARATGAITKKQAEVERDKFLAKLNAPTVEDAVQQMASTGVALFGEVARMYEEGYLGRENQIAEADARQGKVLSDRVHCSEVGHAAPEPDSAEGR